MPQKIKKAVVAVAGSGTRFLPVTKAMPKEMLPVVDKPIIQLLVEELVEGGIEDIILVTKWDKKPLEDHFDRAWALEEELKKSGKKDKLKEIVRVSEMANFIYVRQKGPYGNGTPVISAASIVRDEPFVYCYGDDLVKSKVSFTKQMAEDFSGHGCLINGVQEVPWDQVDKYGIIETEKDSMKIKNVIEKPDIDKSPSNLASFGRFILNQDIIDILKKLPLGKGNELWLVDAVREYVKRGGEFYAKKIEDGEWLTTGDPLSLIKATLEYAMDREDLKKELKEFLRD
jgi:UTP--glucose-1-phosphate uridylyltransferase